MGRRSSPRAVVQSFKKVINEAPASTAAGANRVMVLATGVDSVAAGQTGPTDVQVPTGSVIKYMEILLTVGNSTLANVFAHVAIQYILSTQANISPNVIGGSNQRNQVLHQDMFAVQQSQNTNRKYKFKIPKKFQRLREGMSWRLVLQADLLTSAAGQIIYKFYR